MFSLKAAKTERPSTQTGEAAAPADGALDPHLESKTNGTTISKKLPFFHELPKFHELSGCAWDVWGRDDELGTVNMLTEDVVQRAAREEIWYVAS